MPKKYHIQIKAAAPRFTPVGKSGVMDWQEGCLKCKRCVKTTCVYDVYKQRTFDSRQLTDSIDYFCKNCFRCVQSCPAGLITKTVNPEYLEMGDVYWTPDIISNIWYQAETGKIPVSGAGYGGPFVGDGFDDMWTDMSEIVRPTRDGIHGREYINTSIDLGQKPLHLSFDNQGRFISEPPSLVQIPLPIIFGELPIGNLNEKIYVAMAQAAYRLGTFLVVDPKMYGDSLRPYAQNLIPLLSEEALNKNLEWVHEARIVALPHSETIKHVTERIRAVGSEALVLVKLPLTPKAKQLVAQLTMHGVDIIHVYADTHGRELESPSPHFIKDMVMEIHLHLVERHMRDQVTLLASGGIAMAEHVAKTIICGADGVIIDLPLLVALECRFCRDCFQDKPCPVEIQDIEPDWGAQRIVNLMGAWHGQLLEILGAMGLREVQRLRGEMGRAMFYRDLERETFGAIFGKNSGRN